MKETGRMLPFPASRGALWKDGAAGAATVPVAAARDEMQLNSVVSATVAAAVAGEVEVVAARRTLLCVARTVARVVDVSNKDRRRLGATLMLRNPQSDISGQLACWCKQGTVCEYGRNQRPGVTRVQESSRTVRFEGDTDHDLVTPVAFAEDDLWQAFITRRPHTIDDTHMRGSMFMARGAPSEVAIRVTGIRKQYGGLNDGLATIVLK